MNKFDLFSRCCSIFGVHLLSQVLNKHNIAVLMYHGVTHDNDVSANGNFLQVNESSFRSQIKYLTNKYEVVKLSEALTTKSKKPKAVITFDDGYLNNYTVAYPILKAFNAPATIFIVTSTIDQDHYFWSDKLQQVLYREKTPEQIDRIIDQFKTYHPSEIDLKVDEYLNNVGLIDSFNNTRNENYRTLRYSEIEEMAKSGLITFGSHTHKHELLPHLTDIDVYSTMNISLQIIMGLPNGIPYFCYPNGFNEKRHRRICEQAGYKGAVLATDGMWNPKTNLMAIPRKPIGRNLSFVQFESMVSGTLGIMKRILRKQHVNVTKEGYAFLNMEAAND